MVSARPACLTTFVRASWTIRYAERSALWDNGRGLPSMASSTRTPAARARSSSSSRSPSPAAGRAWAASSSSARSSLSVRCISAHRLAAEVGDPPGGLGHAFVGDGRAERLRLDDDQADVVRDDIVELLRDAHALLGDRPLGQQLALAVEALGALAQRLHARAPAADVEPEAATSAHYSTGPATSSGSLVDRVSRRPRWRPPRSWPATSAWRRPCRRSRAAEA